MTITSDSMRTFDSTRTYYLGADRRRAHDCRAGVYKELVELPANAPIRVWSGEPDEEGEVYVCSLDGKAKGYVHPDCVLDDPAVAAPTEQAQLDTVAAVEFQRRRADVAERALADFKNRVREAVIDEAELQGWCSRIDHWLVELGLPGRGMPIPSTAGSMIRLKDGRIAVHSGDGTDNPWRAINWATGDGAWLDAREASDGAELVLFEN